MQVVKTLTLESWKSIIEIVAIVAAASYFLFQVGAGSFVVGLKLGVRSEEISATDKRYYSVCADVERNAYASLDMLDIRYSVHNLASGKQLGHTKSFSSTERMRFDANDERADENLRLAPNDKMTFCELLEVPGSAPARIEIVLFGKRDWSFPWTAPGQWKSSVIVNKG